jgi:nucleoside-diphosphate-sugar epimerase
MGDILLFGCGYLGRRVAERYLAEGRRVHAATRSPARAAEFRAAGLVPVLCDVTDPSSLQNLPAAATVVHCVGLDRASGRSMREVYVGGLANVLARLPAPRRFVYVSSTSVYGQRDGEAVDEAAATEPGEESGRVVLEAEAVVRSHLPDSIILRFAAIYGPGRLLRAQALRSGQPLVCDPERWLNLIHVEDGAAAVLAAAGRGRPGAVYNVSDGHPVRRHDFYTHLAGLLGAPPPHFVLPEQGTAPQHELAHRRIVSRRLRLELGLSLLYPGYEAGLAASCRGA